MHASQKQFTVIDEAEAHRLGIVQKVLDVTFLALKTAQCPEIIDRVTVIAGYTELWMEYPDAPHFCLRVVDSLAILSDLLISNGQSEVASQIRHIMTLLERSKVSCASGGQTSR